MKEKASFLIQSCNRCSLSKLMPNGRCVPGVTKSHNPQIMLVGEALGREEAEEEEPFVGRCGKFLDIMLESAGLNRDELYITNTVKGRPYVRNGKFKSNRPPTDTEINACKKWLWEEIMEVNPLVICSLGSIPTRLLLNLKKKQTLKSVVGEKCKVEYTPAIVVPMYHPSYIMQYQPGNQYKMEKIFKDVKQYVIDNQVKEIDF